MEFAERAALWRAGREAGLPREIKLAQNSEARTHACLVGWEELPAVSARESAVTGRAVDYRQIDINNVLALPKLLRAEKGSEAT